MTYSVFIVSNDEILKGSLTTYLETTDWKIYSSVFKELITSPLLMSELNETVIILDEPTETNLQQVHQHYPSARLIAFIPQGQSLNTQHFPVEFMEKPFHPTLLKKLLMEENKGEVLLIGDFKLYPHKRRLVHSKTQAIEYLTEKEVDILSFLYHHPRELFSKEELLKRIWNYAPTMTTHTLETHIYRLRQKLDPALLIHQDKGYGLWL